LGPEELQTFLAELLTRISESMKRAEGAVGKPAPPRRRHLYDELNEMLIDFSTRIEAGDKMGALFEMIARVIDLAAGPQPWSLSSPRTEILTRRFAGVAAELLKKNPSLLEGSTPAEHLASFQRLVRHAEGIWRDAVLLYGAEGFARACFLAITCLEEVGKAAPARMTVKIESVYGRIDEKSGNPAAEGDRRDNPLYRHPDKHLLAAASGALFNRRLEGLLGSEEFERVLGMMESRDLKNLRERCLYVEAVGGRLAWPDEITSEVARKWIVVAGEVLAEVMGYPEREWERLLLAVQQFESSVGMVPSADSVSE